MEDQGYTRQISFCGSCLHSYNNPVLTATNQENPALQLAK